MIQSICWVLVHSLWQGLLLALAGGGVILCTKRKTPAVRYRLLCGLSGIFLCVVGATLIYESILDTGSSGGIGRVGVSINWLGDWCTAHAVQVVMVWLTVAIIKSVRMAAGWSYIRRLKREGLAAPAIWRERMDLLSRQLGLHRAVKLVESALVRVPMVIGQLRPIIYVPLGLINHLPANEMEAVLLHELAHIRRYDHVVNLVQQAAECLLFFNPGFLWISSLIREERESCCDDMAIAYTQDPVGFVRALVRFKEHSMGGMALAFPGNRRQLLHRVLRISRQENKTLNAKERLVLLGGCLMVLCLLVARADMKIKVAPAAETRLANAQVARGVSKETLAVLQQREVVTQNMEWVKAQLDQLHQKPAVKKKTSEMDREPMNAERAEQVQRERELKPEQAADRDRQAAADRDRQVTAEQDRQAAAEQIQEQKVAKEEEEVNRAQVELDKLEADKDLKQAELDRQQAERDRHQADLDRLQAEQDRLQAERDRKQAELDRQQADKERDQAARERQQQAEQDRKQAERDRQQARRDQQKSKSN
jgi:bla regulator protein blaR1